MTITPPPVRHRLVYSRVPFKDSSGRWSPRYRGLCSCGFITAEHTGRPSVYREYRDQHVAKIFGW